MPDIDELPRRDRTGLEGLHRSSGQPDWVEVYDNWFVLPEHKQGGYVRFEIRPNEGVTSFQAALIGFDHAFVAIHADCPLPKGRSIELRGPGIWTELSVLDPLTHLTCDLEAFGVSIDPPTDVWAGGFGHRVPVGFELDWDTSGAVAPSPASTCEGYRLVGRAHGEVLVGDTRWDIEGTAVRDHYWGVLPTRSGWNGWTIRDGESIESNAGNPSFDIESVLEGLPKGLLSDGLEVVAWAPAIEAEDRMARALVVNGEDGGWFELRAPRAEL